MADSRAGETTTVNYGWTKPTVGASDDQWGGYLNADLDGIDAIVHGIDTRVIPPGGAIVGATPPASPTPGMLWFDSVGGQTYVWYDDGNTQQWVVAVNAVASLSPATTTTLGGVKVDGTTIKAASDGTISTVLVPMGDNRIINGDMRIDQRNNGAAGTANTGGINTVDRWGYYGAQASKGSWGRNLNAVSGPPGFPYYLGFQSSSAYVSLAVDYFEFMQSIEADQISDFQWGTSNAQAVTLSFWAYSSLTGTFSGAIANYPQTRSYPFTFSLPTANTWTKIAITIPGDTAGTWVMSGNGGGARLQFDLGSGASLRGPANAWASGNYVGATGSVSPVATNGANFNITGVKLEIGSVATPYNRQSLAKSMADCQRYFSSLVGRILFGWNIAGSGIYGTFEYPVLMRAIPTITFSNISYGNASAVGVYSALQSAMVAQAIITNASAGANANFDLQLSAEL